ncbi:MAG: peroxide stress protein YaaA, partial [Acidimicrobiales bacterium]
MIIVVSPAKALDFESPWATQKSSKPSLLKKSEELVGVLSQKSPDQLGS